MALPATVAKELEKLGFLAAGGNETHSLKRFQRRASQSMRKTNAGAAVCVAPTFKGGVTASIDQATLDEINLWLKNGYVAPLGVYGMAAVTGGGLLREDVARSWNDLISRIKGLGGTIDGPYGDTKRPMRKTTKTGTSKYSFHYVGRAVDLNQSLGNPKNQRYFTIQESVGGKTYWRIQCKTEKQTGHQGVNVSAGKMSAYRFGDGVTYKLPEGYYMDLTAEIERSGLFERIPAQAGWGASGAAYNKSEWWHFQWRPDKQITFQDECELVGISEKQLRDAGYTDVELDHPPG